MRALISDGSTVSLAPTRDDPSPGEGEVLVHVRSAALYGVDLAVADGLLEFGGTLGRAFVGTVAAGDGRDGRRVVASTTVRCGACDMCQTGLSTHCRNRTVAGMLGRDGCLADAISLPAANLVDLPDGLDDDNAVFSNLLASALQAARQLTIEGKPYITVLGDGPLGLVTVQVMARLNASVRLIGHHRDKLALCEKWGIKHRHADDVGRRADQDVVIDCTGTAEGLMLAMRLVRPRGTVVLKSLAPPSTIDLAPIVLNELQVVGSWDGPLGEAVNLLAAGEIDVVSLITRRMKLDDGPAILQAARQPDALVVLVGVR